MGVVGTAKLDLLVLEVSCVDLVSLQSEEEGGGYMISFADFNSRISDSETIEDIHIWRSQIIHRPKASFIITACMCSGNLRAFRRLPLKRLREAGILP